MILLSLRGKGEDVFWVSFFHEAYHVLYGERKRLYIAEKKSVDAEEIKADRFAAETLIPAKYNERIVACTSKQEIVDFLDNLNLTEGADYFFFS